MDLGLKNKTVVVTGASRGLGYAVTHGFAEEGGNLVINSRNADALQKAAEKIRQDTKQKVFAFPGDVTDPDFAENLQRFVASQLGTIDILVTNSGGPKPGNFEHFTDQDWLDAFNLNFLSHVRLIRAFLPQLEQSSTPSVLTITSYSVKQPIPQLVLSNAIRAATVGLTKTLSVELAGRNIRFNSILPGWTKTERVQTLLENRAATNHTNFEIEMQKLTNEIPLARMASPEEFAKAAIFLASPAASYMTGIMLTVDGGIVKGTF